MSCYGGIAASLCLVLAVPVAAQKRKNDPPPPVVVKVSTEVPSLAPLAETEQTQTKGGLRITLLPETFSAKEVISTQVRPVRPPTFLGMAVRPSPTSVYVERTEVPRLDITPPRLVLRIQLSNQMSRVFRGSGIAVQFNVAGKTVAVGSSNYGDLINIVIPPRGQQEITIFGPEILSIPAPSTIGIFFFDVVTNIDQAGNVIDKQNFEWYFSYQTQRVEKEMTVPPPERMWMDR